MNIMITWTTYFEFIYPSINYKTLTCLCVPRLDSFQRDIIEGRIR